MKKLLLTAVGLLAPLAVPTASYAGYFGLIPHGAFCFKCNDCCSCPRPYNAFTPPCNSCPVPYPVPWPNGGGWNTDGSCPGACPVPGFCAPGYVQNACPPATKCESKWGGHKFGGKFGKHESPNVGLYQPADPCVSCDPCIDGYAADSRLAPQTVTTMPPVAAPVATGPKEAAPSVPTSVPTNVPPSMPTAIPPVGPALPLGVPAPQQNGPGVLPAFPLQPSSYTEPVYPTYPAYPVYPTTYPYGYQYGYPYGYQYGYQYGYPTTPMYGSWR